MVTFDSYFIILFKGNTATEMKQQLREKEKNLFLLRNEIEMKERKLDQQRCKFEYDNRKRYI